MGVIVIVGRSCSGKSSLQKEISRMGKYSKVVTCTTRQPRLKDNEVDGVHYHFLSKEAFETKLAGGEFVETSEYAGNMYGTLKSDLLGDKVVVVEPVGAYNIKKALGCAAFVIHLDVDSGTCRRGLEMRGTPEDEIEKRVNDDNILFSSPMPFVDRVIDNRGFRTSTRDLAIHAVSSALLFFGNQP
jgi:guanylate kinase